MYLSGQFRGTADFDPGPGTYNLTSVNQSKSVPSYDFFFGSYTIDGALNWARSVGGPGDDASESRLTVDASDVYLNGRFQGTADFDPGPGTTNLTGAAIYAGVVAKYRKADGSLVWAKGVGENTRCTTVDASGNVYAVGYFGYYAATADFDPGPGTAYLTTAGVSDAFLLKLDANGNYLDARRMGGTGDDTAAMVVSVGTTVYVVGSFQAVADFPTGGTLTSQGDHDGFVMALDGPAPSLLRAESTAPSPVRQSLTPAQARPGFARAMASWRPPGADTSRLGHIDLSIANLGGSRPGEASSTSITLDDNAADWGWSIGRGLPSSGRMDLVAAPEHEVGHLHGQSRAEGGLMAETLAPSPRRVAAPSRSRGPSGPRP